MFVNIVSSDLNCMFIICLPGITMVFQHDWAMHMWAPINQYLNDNYNLKCNFVIYTIIKDYYVWIYLWIR